MNVLWVVMHVIMIVSTLMDHTTVIAIQDINLAVIKNIALVSKINEFHHYFIFFICDRY